MNENDPVARIFSFLMKGEDKEQALYGTTGVELLLANNQYDEETAISVHNILAGVYVWNDEYEKADVSQAYFLNNTEWCETYEETVESYLSVVFAKDNRAFIEATLNKYPLIKDVFSDLYKSYLSMIVNPNDEENYNPNNVHYFQLLETSKRMYC